MDNDDALVGRILNRRDAVRLMLVSGAALAAGYGKAVEDARAATLPGCVVRPEATVGPTRGTRARTTTAGLN
jgi:hypothetical protein